MANNGLNILISLFFLHMTIKFNYVYTIANPLRSSDVVAVAFSLALLMWSLLHERLSGPSCSSIWCEDGVTGGICGHVQQHVYGVLLLPKMWLFEVEYGRPLIDLISRDTYLLLLLHLFLGDKTNSLWTGYSVLLELCVEKLDSLIWICFVDKYARDAGLDLPNFHEISLWVDLLNLPLIISSPVSLSA